MSHTPFQDTNRRDLEDLFFLKQDQKLIEQLKAMQQMAETKEAIAKVSGITDDAILDKLIKLSVRPETLASLALVPLVEIAWADGKVDEREKAALLKAAIEQGFDQNSIDYKLLETWATHRPSPRLMDAWVHYVQGLCQQLTDTEKQNLKAQLIGHAREIATSSGGFLGLGNVSKSEQRVLEKLEAAFDGI